MVYFSKKEGEPVKRMLCAAAAACCLLAAAGCTAGPDGDAPAFSAESYAALPGIDLVSLLTEEEIAAGLGCKTEALAEPFAYDDGASVRYASADHAVTLDVHVQRPSEELRAYARDNCAGLETTPNLGDTAYFDRENVTLIVFFGAYILTVNEDSEAGANERLSVERHFAALVGERLLRAEAS